MKWAKAMAVTAPLLLGTGTLTTLTVTAALVASPAATAADKKQQLSSKVGKPLQAAQALAQKGQFKEAMAEVRTAAAVSGKTPYEEKVVNEFTAYVAMNLRDYATATKAYEATLASPLLTKEELPQRLSTLAKLNYQLKQYNKVETYANRYQKEVGYDAEMVLLLAQSQYVQKNYAAAEQAMGELIKRSATPKEEWLKLRMSSLHNLQRRDEVIQVLEQLLVRYPSTDYWNDMIAYLQSAPGNTDRISLETFRLKYQVSTLEADEYMEMSELALALGQYGEALSLLQSGFDKGILGKDTGGRDQRLLALAKKEAQEDQASLATVAKEAQASKTGEVAVRLGEAYMNYGKYAEAERSIAAGLAKGSVKSTDEAQLHRGIALVKLKRNQDAIAAFKAVPASSSLARVARLWVIYASKA